MVIRPATSADVDSMGSLMFVEPAREAVVLAGGVEHVDMAPPPGSFHLVELQVHPRHRGRGTGGVLLDTVDADARASGASLLSLTTGSSNPARRLYERHGFSVVRERRGRRYARLTGIPGRVLMVKQLRAGP